MRFHFSLPLGAVALFCLTSMAGCPNNMPAGQYTVAQGYVINRRTNQPLPGVRVAVVSAPTSLLYYDNVVDSVLTDRQGHYALSFTNTKGLYYAVNCGVLDTYNNVRPVTLDFPDSLVNGVGGYPSLATVALTLGRANNVKFWPSPRRVWKVQVTTLTTGYERLFFRPYGAYTTWPANNLRRQVLLYQALPFTSAVPQRFYQTPGTPFVADFTRQPATGAAQDTLVPLQVSSPLTGDTVTATLRFGN